MKISSFLSYLVVAITLTSANCFAAENCTEAKNAKSRATILEQRNKFLNTKFARSGSAPAASLELARAARIACRANPFN